MANTYEEGSQATVKTPLPPINTFTGPVTVDPNVPYQQQVTTGAATPMNPPVAPAPSTGSFTPASDKSAQMAQQEATASKDIVATKQMEAQATMPTTTVATPYVDITADDIATAKEMEAQMARDRLPVQQPVQLTGTKTTTTKTGTGTGTGSGAGTGVTTGTQTTIPVTPSSDQVSATADSAQQASAAAGISAAQEVAKLTQPQAWKPLLDQAASTKFDWQSATDPAYLQEASNLENQVASMMVGRGGLYSSVYQSALQSRLTELQISMRQQRYGEFIQERNWLMQQAEFIANREDTAYSQGMQALNYQAGREDSAFSKGIQTLEYEANRADTAFQQQYQMLNYQLELENQKFNQWKQRAELSLAQAKFAYSKEQATLAQKVTANKVDIANLGTTYRQQSDLYSEYMEEWSQSGYPSATVQAFFGIPATTSFWSASGQAALDNRKVSIESYRTLASNIAQANGEDELAIQAAKGFIAGTAAEVKQVQENTNYNDARYQLAYNINNASDAMSAITNLKMDSVNMQNPDGMSNKAYAIEKMGEDNYNKLLTELQGTYSAYKNPMD